MSLITGITTFGDVFSVGINGSITSQIFIEYLNNLDSFLQGKVGVFLSNCLIIMDNASIHRSKKNERIYIKEKNTKCCLYTNLLT